MKSLYIPALVLALLLAGSLASAAYVAQQVNRCTQTLQRAEALAREERWDKAEQELRSSHQSWLQGQGYFHAIVEHGELDEGETLFAAAFAACDARDEPDFHAILAQLQTSLEHLSEKQQLRLGNIL